MDEPRRWIVAIVGAVAILALIVFARGEPDHGEPTSPPAVTDVMAA